jgi:hypothetical protein
LVVVLLGVVLAASGCQLDGSPFAWTQFGGDAAHSSANTSETSLSPTTVAANRLLWRAGLDAAERADGAPVFVPDVVTPSGLADLVLVTTRQGSLVALNWATGGLVWRRAFPYPGVCRLHGLDGQPPCYTTSSPAVNPAHTMAYTYGLDGIVHEVRVADGTETTFRKVVTNKPMDEKGSSALATATARNGHTYLYVASSGYPDPPGDFGDYQGHLSTFDLTDGSEHVFNTVCSDRAIHFTYDAATDCTERMGAVWARPGVVYNAANDRIYLTTGNATFDPQNHHWGDSVLALHADGTGNGAEPVDAYTPANHQVLEDQDLDLGSTAPAILPVPAGSSVAHVGLQSGKDAQLRLLDLDDLSGQGGPGHTGGELSVIPVPMGGMVFSMPAVWIDPVDGATWTFVTNGNGTAAFKVVLDSQHVPTLALQWQRFVNGTSPLIANGVLYVAGSLDTCFFCGDYVDRIGAYDPRTGELLWKNDVPAPYTQLHWQSPVVANGVLLLEDGHGSVSAYGVDATTLPGAPLSVRATPGVRRVSVAWSAPESSGASYPTTSLPTVGYTVVASPGGAGCTWGGGPLTCEVTGLDPTIGYSFVVTASNAVGTGPPSFPTGEVHPIGGAGFAPLTPTRVLDSRTAVGGWGATPLVAGTPRALVVTAASSAPATVRAVVANLTVTGSTAPTYLSGWPKGAPPSTTSLVNVPAGATVANQVTLAVGAGGAVELATAHGTADVVVDVVGYYEDDAPNLFVALEPTRILDSRTQLGGWSSPLVAGTPRAVGVHTLGGVPPGATALVANLTVTGGTKGSFVSAYPSGSPSTSSAINFAAGETIANMVTLPVGADGSITFANAIGAVSVVVDVVGYYRPGSGARFYDLPPVRILDDRVGVGATAPWGEHEARTVSASGAIPVTAKALAVNITATNGSAPTFLTVQPSGIASEASTLNVAAGQTIAHGTVTGVLAQSFCITNRWGTVDVIADAQGYFA